MDDLIAFLNGFHKTPKSVLEAYVKHWKPYHCDRKAYLTPAGQVERYLYFVEAGIQKSYFQADDKEHVMFFGYPPSFSGVMESFLNQKPSHYYLQCLTPSRFLRIDFNTHQKLLTEHKELDTLFRVITEKLLFGLIERYHDLMAHDMETRFRSFTKRSPHLLNMVSQKDLASYLRIDPTNFSKLMNKVQI